jgi:hypothetical protein
MTERNDKPGGWNWQRPRRGVVLAMCIRLAAWCIILAVCTCLAAALMYAQVSDHIASGQMLGGEGVGIGWPFVSRIDHWKYGYRPHVSNGWSRLNLLICAALLSLAAARLVCWLSPRRRFPQFTLSDLLVHVTAVGIVLFLFIWDSNSEPIGLPHRPQLGHGNYLALSTFPIYLQLPIWFCVYVAVVSALKLALVLAKAGMLQLRQSNVSPPRS